MQSVEEGKARLIVKRIVADIVRDQSVPLGCEWESLNAETREQWVSGWIKIASEVLGEEVEPPDPEEVLKQLCKQLGHEAVMEKAAVLWMVDDYGSRIVGPNRGDLVSCECEHPTNCEWCCGIGKLTHRVKQAKEEAERPKEEKETHEEYGGNPHVWNQFVFHTGWTEGFVDRMRERGAVKVEVPVSPAGSIAVEFPKLSEVTSGALRLTQDEREQIAKLLKEADAVKKPESVV